MPTVNEIVDLTAKAFAIRPIEIRSERREQYLVRPRQLACWLARRHTLASLPKIGRAIGNRDHTTVLHAVKKVEAKLASDPAMLAMARRLEATIAAIDRQRTIDAGEDLPDASIDEAQLSLPFLSSPAHSAEVRCDYRLPWRVVVALLCFLRAHRACDRAEWAHELPLLRQRRDREAKQLLRCCSNDVAFAEKASGKTAPSSGLEAALVDFLLAERRLSQAAHTIRERNMYDRRNEAAGKLLHATILSPLNSRLRSET